MASLGQCGISDEQIELVAEFASRVTPLGVQVDRVADSQAAATCLAAALAEIAAPRLTIALELGAAAPALMTALDQGGVHWHNPATAQAARDMPLGVSLARQAVAETGSLLMAEERLADRAVGMLTKTQVIICRTEAIVPSLVEAAASLRAIALRPGGGYATLVTGPSRTADIELSLTVGVQGPGRLLVLFVDDLG